MTENALVNSPNVEKEQAPLDVAVVIVSWNVRHYLAECLRSVLIDLQRSRLKGEIWIVDNASTDGSVEFIRDLFPTVHIIENENNVGFGAANNQGMQAAMARNPRHFFLLNPDTLVRPSAMLNMVRWLDNNPQAGVAGARLVFGDGQLQHSAFEFPGLRQLIFEFWPIPHRLYETRLNGRYPARWYDHSDDPFLVDHPLGAAMMVRREVFEMTQGFDEAYHMYCEEIDWAWRIHHAGWDIYTVPSAEIVHYGGKSSSQVRAQSVIELWRSRAKLYSKYTRRPWQLKLARRIVRSGLARKAALANTPELKQAYEEASSAW